MLKNLKPMLFLPLLALAGCTATFTNLTPSAMVRSPDNQYKVEVAFTSRQQTLRWESIKPHVEAGGETYTMRPTLMMTNRWECMLPVPPTTRTVHYRYKFDFLYNAMGGPLPDSARSEEYTFRILDK
ncbi:MAG TPA: hypothetical protein VLT36_25795 [Candidatus Dormibacteraeota bacterium]|nr:hypothetical protein [Candidatus Dormibacteraeota bacterium]